MVGNTTFTENDINNKLQLKSNKDLFFTTAASSLVMATPVLVGPYGVSKRIEKDGSTVIASSPFTFAADTKAIDPNATDTKVTDTKVTDTKVTDTIIIDTKEPDTKNTDNKNMDTKDKTTKDIATKNTETKDKTAKDTATKDIDAKNTNIKDTATKDVATKEIATNNMDANDNNITCTIEQLDANTSHVSLDVKSNKEIQPPTLDCGLCFAEAANQQKDKEESQKGVNEANSVDGNKVNQQQVEGSEPGEKQGRNSGERQGNSEESFYHLHWYASIRA